MSRKIHSGQVLVLIWKLMRGPGKLSTAVGKKPFLLVCTYLHGVHLLYPVACTMFQLQWLRSGVDQLAYKIYYLLKREHFLKLYFYKILASQLNPVPIIPPFLPLLSFLVVFSLVYQQTIFIVFLALETGHKLHICSRHPHGHVYTHIHTTTSPVPNFCSIWIQSSHSDPPAKFCLNSNEVIL